MQPLYETAGKVPARRDPDGHAGLWFDKFCNKWDGNWNVSKTDWISAFTECEAGTRNQIEENALRLLRLVRRCRGRAEVFTTASRFVTGLGRSHPLENGFAWHPTLGVPYLPGSSMKGMVHAWTKQEADPEVSGETAAPLPGCPENTGRVIFLDAIPVAPVRLEADILTPHYAGWDEECPPGDWRSPVPVPFLVTAAQTPFLFAVIPCRHHSRNNHADDLETIFAWLRSALAWAGAGAKTSVGYGRFRADKEKTDDWDRRLNMQEQKRREQREQAEARKTPAGRWRLELEGKSEEGVLELVRIHLEKEPLQEPAEKRAFAQAVRATGLSGGWRRGEKCEPQTRVGKKKLQERDRLLRNALQ